MRNISPKKLTGNENVGVRGRNVPTGLSAPKKAKAVKVAKPAPVKSKGHKAAKKKPKPAVTRTVKAKAVKPKPATKARGASAIGSGPKGLARR